ncbi:helix-turn-helix transcriptional regulator, partial [Streptomyces sp. NPDC005534]|uniref:helix-turn-helix domain-containing protein n=1 Tax=Streptomyces sp. NPDC005534 TaxID=3155714 RepID=UPI0034569D62
DPIAAPRMPATSRPEMPTGRSCIRRCRALPWLRQVETAAAHHTAAPSLAPAALDTLATTERQVAALVMEGATNREIAARLFISVKTVEATLTRVYRKLGIRSRVDIVRLAAERRAD